MSLKQAHISNRDISNNSSARLRIKWIDALRAIAMIFVIYGHLVPDFTGYFVFTSPIKITLFFAITGYVFKENVETKTFFYKLFRQLVIPWIVLSIGPYIILSPIKGIPYLLEHVVNILIGKKNWYMPACIIAEIIWYFILKTRKKWLYGTIVIIAFIAGIVLYKRGILNIFMMNRALCVLLYMFMGYLFRQHEERINNHQMTVLTIICVVVYVALGIVTLHFYPGQSLDVHLNYFYSYPICFAMVLTGLISLTVITKRIEVFPIWFLLVGQNTLVIYLFHSFVVAIVQRLFRFIHLPINALTSVLITVITCAVCTVLAIVINRFIPGLLGKKLVKQE